MQIASALIENFRKIERLELNFTDSLGRVRDVAVLVGPNGAGKTTVLDALAAAIGPSTELPATRPSLSITPRTIVRKGAQHARVTCVLRFSAEEIEVARKLGSFFDPPRSVPDAPEVTLTWTYPDPGEQHRSGLAHFSPQGAWALLKARVWLARLLRTNIGNASFFERAGRVVTFDQQRSGLGRTIRRDILRIIDGADTEDESGGDGKWITDPRTILLDLAVRAQIPLAPGATADDAFQRIQQCYAELCAPRRILGAVREDLGTLDIRFSDGENEYGYDGVSSGESMVLLFLIRMVTERVHRSIVLVDELELHEHPVWQRRLLHLLPSMGELNQIIATTHSSYLRDVLPRGSVIDLGDLGDGAEDAANG